MRAGRKLEHYSASNVDSEVQQCNHPFASFGLHVNRSCLVHLLASLHNLESPAQVPQVQRPPLHRCTAKEGCPLYLILELPSIIMSSHHQRKFGTTAPKLSGGFDNIRSAVLATGSDARVEVNQRSLIDKILARYASAGAVYRELLQNSNDAEASLAEIHFTTSPAPNGPVVDQVVYKNDGMPFRPQDWSRLRKIAEGNPDVSKVGAFGVGAYAIFSICEEPLVVSGGQALAFSWKGDSLWVKLGDAPGETDKWTSFVLKSRDPYSLPDLVEFGQFLCSNLTFTTCLKNVVVFVDGTKRLTISKREVFKPRIVSPPKASSWWSGDGAVTTSPKRIFTLGQSDGSIIETTMEMSVDIDGDLSKIRARYVSAIAMTRVPSDMARRMERVTKKRPPSQVKIEIFIDADASSQSRGKRKGSAAKITDAFSPGIGSGRVFIGFKTSQTTGLAAHLAAPLFPTVEREAIDFQDPTLRVYNCELLSIAGILMRLTLEHSMSLIGEQWAKTETERVAFEEMQKARDSESKAKERTVLPPSKPTESATTTTEEETANPVFSFARFMSSGVKKIADVISSVDFMRDDDAELLKPNDSRPLSKEEQDAILLMRSFAPQQSTPHPNVGTVLAKGFEGCLPGLSPPVLTSSGVMRGLDSRLPFQGIEGFVKCGIVRNVIFKNAENYLLHVAGCQKLTIRDLVTHLRSNPLDQDDVVRILKWWTKYARADPSALAQGQALRESISLASRKTDAAQACEKITISLQRLEHYLCSSHFTSDLPMPDSVLPKGLLDNLPLKVLKDKTLLSWFAPLPVESWVDYIASHPCLTDGKAKDAEVRLRVLAVLSREHATLSGKQRLDFGKLLRQRLSNIRCIPVEGRSQSADETDFPGDLYFPSAELEMFNDLGSFNTVSTALSISRVSEDFLVALGVRKTVSIDFLFTQLERLKWSQNPKPLIRYLRTVKHTAEDLEKLRSTQYLPERNDKTRTYAPSELYLPNPELFDIPFAKILQWPSTDSLHEESPDAEFLKKVGCHVDPPLRVLMQYLTSDIKTEELRQRGLDFLYRRLATEGPYQGAYTTFLDTKFLPATAEDPLHNGGPRKELQAPSSCYSSTECSCLGFPILDSSLNAGRKRAYAQIFRCATKPSAHHLVHQLLIVVSNAKRAQLSQLTKGTATTDNVWNDRILNAFEEIFSYMSSRSMELDKAQIEVLHGASFIPHRTGNSLNWYHPKEIYFESVDKDENSDLASDLFFVRGFSPFLATVGVKNEPSTEDIFRLLLSSPQETLEKLGSESRYRFLLRRIAANPPYREVTTEMKKSPFLLAYRLYESEKTDGTSSAENNDSDKRDVTATADDVNVPIAPKYALAKAEDICIIDNSHFSRMFNVFTAPQESDIERLYETLGSMYISKRVNQTFYATGPRLRHTQLTNEFRDRIKERRPLLVSNIMSQQLMSGAAAALSDDNLEIYEVFKIKATYSFEQQTKTEYVTCAAQREGSKKKLSLYITHALDWFHVGNAIGNVILDRCNVPDAFFIGSLLEAPLSQLRARGFPVDRILRAAEPMQQESERTSVEPERSPETRNHPKPETPKLKTQPQPRDTAPSGGDSSQQNAPVEKRTASGGKKRKGDLFSRTVQGLLGMSGSGRSRSPAVKLDPVKKPEGVDTRSSVGQSTVSDMPPNDVATREAIKETLRKSVKSTRPISDGGVIAQAGVIAVPATVSDAAKAPECEATPATDLKPFDGPHRTGKTASGMRVFSRRGRNDSERFLEVNWNLVERFENVLGTIAKIFSLPVETMAIYHDSRDRVVAFNLDRRLYFNVRYFANLHYRDGITVGLDCYAYWFCTTAHELSHNMVAGHNKDHGFYTENYISTYLPKLMSTLKDGDIN